MCIFFYHGIWINYCDLIMSAPSDQKIEAKVKASDMDAE